MKRIKVMPDLFHGFVQPIKIRPREKIKGTGCLPRYMKAIMYRVEIAEFELPGGKRLLWHHACDKRDGCQKKE
jgi:hypothetical protein